MAHRYDNFDDAFEQLVTYWEGAEYVADGLFLKISQAQVYANAGNWLQAIFKITYALDNIRYVFDWFNYFYNSDPNQSPLLESIYWASKDIPKTEVTMRSILDVMFTASNEELKQFIALVDAYRQSLWNKPFDVNYWAAVARGFEQWEF